MIVSDDYIDKALDYINDEPLKALNLAQYKLYKRPKLRLNRLVDEKKIVPIVVIISIKMLLFKSKISWTFK